MKNAEYKPILCLDFDGVLHSYSSGWKGPRNIPDPPVPGAMKFLAYMVFLSNFQVVIHSSRARYFFGIAAMRQWLLKHLAKHLKDFAMADDAVKRIVFYKKKPPAMVTLDDRAMTFTGVFPKAEELESFVPWNKKGEV